MIWRLKKSIKLKSQIML